MVGAVPSFEPTSKNDDLPLVHLLVMSKLDVGTSELLRAVDVRATASFRGVSSNKAFQISFIVDCTRFVVLFVSLAPSF